MFIYYCVVHFYIGTDIITIATQICFAQGDHPSPTQDCSWSQRIQGVAKRWEVAKKCSTPQLPMLYINWFSWTTLINIVEPAKKCTSYKLLNGSQWYMLLNMGEWGCNVNQCSMMRTPRIVLFSLEPLQEIQSQQQTKV